MKSDASQMKIAEVAENERKLELEALGDEHAIVLEKLFAACKAVVRDMTADDVANELDAMWANRGRPVTAPVLRSSLADSRGNYFRLEWILYFAEQSAKVRELLVAIGMGDGAKEPKDELDDLKDVIRREYPNQADRLIQKGKAPRRR